MSTIIGIIVISTHLDSLSLYAEQAIVCVEGGYGSQSCSIDAGVNIAGYGVTAGCSVSCINGYFSCCALTCRCYVDGTSVIMIPKDDTSVNPII